MLPHSQAWEWVPGGRRHCRHSPAIGCMAAGATTTSCAAQTPSVPIMQPWCSLHSWCPCASTSPGCRHRQPLWLCPPCSPASEATAPMAVPAICTGKADPSARPCSKHLARSALCSSDTHPALHHPIQCHGLGTAALTQPAPRQQRFILAGDGVGSCRAASAVQRCSGVSGQLSARAGSPSTPWPPPAERSE